MTPHADTQNITDLLWEFEFSDPEHFSGFHEVLKLFPEVDGADTGTQVSDLETTDSYPEYD